MLVSYESGTARTRCVMLVSYETSAHLLYIIVVYHEECIVATYMTCHLEIKYVHSLCIAGL